MPGADNVMKGCPSEGCLWLLRTGPAVGGGGAAKEQARPGEALAPI